MNYLSDAKDTFLDLGRADALNARNQQYLEVSKTLPLLEPFGLPCNSRYSDEGCGDLFSPPLYRFTDSPYSSCSKLNIRKWIVYILAKALVDFIDELPAAQFLDDRPAPG